MKSLVNPVYSEVPIIHFPTLHRGLYVPHHQSTILLVNTWIEAV